MSSAGVAVLVAGALASPSASAPRGAGRVLLVDAGRAGCSDAAARDGASRPARFCTLQAAAAAARAGDTVLVLPGRYRGTVRPLASGTASAPIRFVARPGTVVVDAAGAPVALRLVGVSWIDVQGFEITGAAAQGVYAEGAAHISLTRLDVHGNGRQGIQVRAVELTVADSSLTRNGMAGISELAGSRQNVYRDNTIAGNGADGRPYDGDGVQLDGAGATVGGNTITGNGDPGIYEHGVYAGRTASDYLIEGNVLAGNAASDIKAAGSGGVVRYNRLGDSRLGLVLSDNRRPVAAYYNVIAGRFLHAVFLTSGSLPARARLWQNTIVQTGSPAREGAGAAVFVNSASLADIRNDLICNAAAGGVALAVRDPAYAHVVSGANWFCSDDPRRREIEVGGVRTSLDGWRAAAGRDTASLGTRAPAFTPDFRVASPNLGAGRGRPLGLARDYVGAPVPPLRPDIGAYQTPVRTPAAGRSPAAPFFG